MRTTVTAAILLVLILAVGLDKLILWTIAGTFWALVIVGITHIVRRPGFKTFMFWWALWRR